MLNRIYLWLKAMNQPRKTTWVVVVAVLSLAALSIRSSQFKMSTPDSQFYYDAQYLEDFFCCTGQNSASESTTKSCAELKNLYIWTQLTFDTIFPLAYGALLGIFIVKHYPIDSAKLLLLIPAIATTTDIFLENSMLAWLAYTWTCGTEFTTLAKIVPCATATKWIFFWASVILVSRGWLYRNREAVPARRSLN